MKPEEVLKEALKQWIEARLLHRAPVAVSFITEKRQERSDHKSTAEKINKTSISIKVAYFIVIGGFVRCEGCKKPITYSKFFHAFVEDTQKVSCMVKEVDIADKGKVNLLAKLVACVQSSWFVLHVLGRQLTGLPIAL